MHHELHTEIDIDATPAEVWQVLTDLEGWADWNPFITSSIGTPEVGETLVNRMEPPGGKAITFKPKVTVVEDTKTFEWLGKLGFSGVFDGRHRFEVEASPTGTRFVQSETLDGMLVRVMRKSLDTKTTSGFIQIQHRLEREVEGSIAKSVELIGHAQYRQQVRAGLGQPALAEQPRDLRTRVVPTQP